MTDKNPIDNKMSYSSIPLENVNVTNELSRILSHRLKETVVVQPYDFGVRVYIRRTAVVGVSHDVFDTALQHKNSLLGLFETEARRLQVHLAKNDPLVSELLEMIKTFSRGCVHEYPRMEKDCNFCRAKLLLEKFNG